MLTSQCALIMRLILAFEMDEANGPRVREPDIDILGFSDVRNSLVSLPRRFDCYYTPLDPVWRKVRGVGGES